MKKTCILLIVLPVMLSASAQYVSLNNNETGKLKALIQSEPDVKLLYAAYERAAAEALNATPNPIDTISTEGRLKGDPKKTATAASLQDMYKMYSLALVYRIGGDKKYLQKADAFLLAWAAINRSKGDPIDDTNLDNGLEAYDLIKSDISAADNQAIANWLTQVAEAEINTLVNRPKRGTAANNWNSHRLKIIGEIGYAIGVPRYQQFATDELKKQIAKNLYPDGSGLDFKDRDALHYHVYTLEPLLKLAIVLKRATKVDYYSYVSETGSSIKTSTEWLLPFVTGEKTHQEFVHSTVRFDSLRAANHEAGYVAGTLFDPMNGLRVLALAAYFNPEYTNTYQTVKKTGKGYNDWQLVLNKVML